MLTYLFVVAFFKRFSIFRISDSKFWTSVDSKIKPFPFWLRKSEEFAVQISWHSFSSFLNLPRWVCKLCIKKRNCHHIWSSWPTYQAKIITIEKRLIIFQGDIRYITWKRLKPDNSFNILSFYISRDLQSIRVVTCYMYLQAYLKACYEIKILSLSINFYGFKEF